MSSYINKTLMNRKVQKLAAQALGVKDEAVFADQTANKWARKISMKITQKIH